MKKILLATRNWGKVEEIQAILQGLPFAILTMRDFPDVPEVIEDGSTLEENALKKAKEVHRSTGLPVLADDSGLEVEVLGMHPGVISARYAGEGATYEDNNAKLLKELATISMQNCNARFRCIAAFVDAQTEKLFEGICSGTIAEIPRGTGGFGYDPLFVPDGYKQSFAELPPEVKNTLSHRAQAFRLMKQFLSGKIT